MTKPPIMVAMSEWASIKCAEKDRYIAQLTEAFEINKIQLMELATIATDKEAAIKELVEGLRSNDETLSYLEDFTHGYEGHKITQQIGENQQLIQKHKV